MIKYLEKSDDKFIKATKSAVTRSEMIKQQTQVRLFGTVGAGFFGIYFLLNMLMKQPTPAGMYFIFLIQMILVMNADQQIKMLKYFNEEDKPEEA